MSTQVVIISDTHGYHDVVNVPAGDLLIHCGDFTQDASQMALRSFLQWFESQPHEHKVFVAGNHDWAFEKWPDLARLMVRELAPSCVYLQDAGHRVGEIEIWGSPVQPWFFGWAFNRERGSAIARHWAMIPKRVDVLITHGPPSGFLDKTDRGERVGCVDLLEAVKDRRPILHCFGHIHHDYGTGRLKDGGSVVDFVNASICDEAYKPSRKPTIYHL